MAEITKTIDAFSLQSKWKVTEWHWDDGHGGYTTTYTYGSPRSDDKTVTVNLSEIPTQSRVISATFRCTTSSAAGDSYAKCNDFSINLTNNAASNGKDATNWLAPMSGGTYGSLSIEFSHSGYGGTPSGSSTCRYSDISLTIVYELPNSSGTLNTAIVDIGGTITLNINPVNSTYTHNVSWKLDTENEYGRSVPLSAGVTADSWQIPSSYIQKITTSSVANATAYLETLNNGSRVGEIKTYSFQIQVPSNIVPVAGTLRYVSSVGDANNTLIQGTSSATLILEGAAGGQYASIASVLFSGWGSSAYGVASNGAIVANTGILTSGGTITISATVTDSRGRTAVTSIQVVVYTYTHPTIIALNVKRCDENGVFNDTGEYVKLYVDYEYSYVNGNNRVNSSSIEYKIKSDSAYTSSSEVLTQGQETGGSVIKTVTGSYAFIGSSEYKIHADNEYVFRVTITDIFGGSTYALYELPTANYVLHFKNGGKSIGIGRAAMASDNTLAVNSNWRVYIGDDANDIISKIPTIIQNASIASSQFSDNVPITKGGTGSNTLLGAQTALGITNIVNSLEDRIKAGQYITFQQGTCFYGFITSSRTEARFCIPLGRYIEAQNATISGSSGSGYIITPSGKEYGTNDPVTISGFGTITFAVPGDQDPSVNEAARRSGMIYMRIQPSSNYSNNNVPAIFSIESPITLYFY